MLRGRGWQASSYRNYTSLDLLLLFRYCFVRLIVHRRMNEKGISIRWRTESNRALVNKIGERSKDRLQYAHTCESLWILVNACPQMRYTYKKSVVCSKCKHCIIRDYIFEIFLSTKSIRALSTKLGKDPKIAYSMHIRVNLSESWLMLVHKWDTHTRSPLFVPNVSIVLSATISLKKFCRTFTYFWILNLESSHENAEFWLSHETFAQLAGRILLTINNNHQEEIFRNLRQ